MKEIQKVLVVGVGAMGAGIAQVTAQSGFDVLINDMSEERLKVALELIETNYRKSVSSGMMTEVELAESMARIKPITDLREGKDADIVIEAIIEKPEAKKDLFEQLSQICRPDVIMASNTSTVSISDIASISDHPENYIGLHFFNPPAKMKLIEAVTGFFTSKETMDTCIWFAEKLGKQCILSEDTAGFIVNHLLIPMLNESVILLGKGIGTVEDIDKGMRLGCNHPMGPLELIDLIGADITLSIMEILLDESGDSKYRPSQLLKRMVRAHQLGRKTGRGFYLYDEKGKKIGINIKKGV